MPQANCGEWDLRLSPPALSPVWGQLLPLPPLPLSCGSSGSDGHGGWLSCTVLKSGRSDPAVAALAVFFLRKSSRLRLFCPKDESPLLVVYGEKQVVVLKGGFVTATFTAAWSLILPTCSVKLSPNR